MKKKPGYLSADALHVITFCLDKRLAWLEETHWRAVHFGPEEKFFKNMNLERATIEKAKSEVCATFEAQFTK